MKFRYILSMIVAALTLCFAGCQKEEARLLDEVKVSQSYIAIPAEGGQVGVTVNAVDNWEITEIPEWLTVSPSTGAAGETVVTFSAGATDATNNDLLYLNCAGASQVLNVFQMTEAAEIPITSCEVINASAEVGKIYRVKGAVTDITNYEKYGCFYVNDGTSDKDVYVYGSLNSDKFNVEVGDIITFEGPWTSYGNFDDVTIVELEKSLIKVEEVSPEDATLPLAGGEFTVTLTCKGDGISVVVPDEAKSWLSVVSVNTSGTEAVVTFSAGANAAGDRSADLKFVTTSGGVEYSAFTTLNQKGSIIDATIAEFLAAAESSTLYRVTGNIKRISVNTQYHNASVVIFDGAGNEVDLYRLAAVDANIEDLGLVAGDLITVVGKRSSYNGKPQMAEGGYVESFVHYVPATIEEFLAVSTSSEEIYRVSGKIVNIKEVNASYNNANLTIADEDGNELYLYRMKPAEGGKKINEIGFAVGDVLTVTGQRGEYNGNPQMINGVYVSHESGSAEEGGEDGGDADGAVSVTFADKGFANAEVVDGVEIKLNDDVAVVFGKGEASTAPAYYDSGLAIRMYQNGATLDVKAPGKTITKIELTFASNHYYLAADSGTLSEEAAVRTWTGEAAAVKFTSTGTDKNHRAYVSAIKVYYN